MSTKYTLDYGENHCLYLEIFEAGKIYLTLSGVEFEARPDAVTVAIPLDVWERIRGVPIDTGACLWDDEPEPDSPPASSPGHVPGAA